MVPAMVVRSPSVGKRRIGLIPERPAVSAAQLSAFPRPSDVTIPMPVTTTMGRPLGSVSCVAMALAFHALEEGKPLAAPMSEPGHQHAVQLPGEGFLDTGRVERRKKSPCAKGKRSQGDTQRKMCFDAVSEARAVSAN